MADELTLHEKGELIRTIDKEGIGEVLKPLIRRLHLFDTFVAGTTHLEDGTVLDEIKADDNLILLREENKFDDKAIVILTEDRRKIGYVPEKDNLIFSRLMDAGKLLGAKIKKIERKGSFHQISIGIYLMDF